MIATLRCFIGFSRETGLEGTGPTDLNFEFLVFSFELRKRPIRRCSGQAFAAGKNIEGLSILMGVVIDN